MECARDFPHYLLTNGVIDNNQLKDVLTTCERTQDKPGRVVVKKGYVDKDKLLSMLQNFSKQSSE